jgi:transcriptional regulator with XRE-family HTH domain
MGRARRPQPARLAEKLLAIRNRLGLSQGQMVRRLESEDIRLYAAHLSGYEAGTREPPLQILLNYARTAGIAVEILIDDKLDLPDRLPIRRKRRTRPSDAR